MGGKHKHKHRHKHFKSSRFLRRTVLIRNFKMLYSKIAKFLHDVLIDGQEEEIDGQEEEIDDETKKRKKVIRPAGISVFLDDASMWNLHLIDSYEKRLAINRLRCRYDPEHTQEDEKGVEEAISQGKDVDAIVSRFISSTIMYIQCTLHESSSYTSSSSSSSSSNSNSSSPPTKKDKKSDVHKKTDGIAEDVAEEESTPDKEGTTSDTNRMSKQKLLSGATRRYYKGSTSKEEVETKSLDSDDKSDPDNIEEEQASSADEQGSEKETVVPTSALKGSGSKNIIDLNAGDGLDIGSSPVDVPKKHPQARRE